MVTMTFFMRMKVFGFIAVDILNYSAILRCEHYKLKIAGAVCFALVERGK